MSDKYLKKDIDPSCGYCKNGKLSSDGTKIFCVKKGIMDIDGYCKRFNYDILKREPKTDRPLPQFDSEDFKVE